MTPMNELVMKAVYLKSVIDAADALDNEAGSGTDPHDKHLRAVVTGLIHTAADMAQSLINGLEKQAG